MNQRQNAMEASRDAIVCAAGQQFAAFGYEATSFARIAEAMGKPRSSIGYHLFPSKLALASAVIERQQLHWEQIDAHFVQEHGLKRMVTLLLTSAVETRTSTLAAGAIRLIHELPRFGLEIPQIYNWRQIVQQELQAAEDTPPGSGLVDAASVALLLNATYGLIASSTDIDPHDFESQLKSLWRPLLTAMGFPNAGAIVDGVRPLEA